MAVDNLYVTYDDGGTAHFYINDDEVDEQVWKLRHPMMKEDKGNGRDSIGGRSQRSDDAVAADGPDAKERRAQGLRDQRKQARLARQGQIVVDHVEDGSGGEGA